MTHSLLPRCASAVWLVWEPRLGRFTNYFPEEASFIHVLPRVPMGLTSSGQFFNVHNFRKGGPHLPVLLGEMRAFR